MDRNKLDIAVISVGPPIYFYDLAPELGLEAAKLANDGIAQMVAKRPDRLRGMAHLPMQDPDAAIAELERAVREHKFKAVEVGTSIEQIWFRLIGRARKVLSMKRRELIVGGRHTTELRLPVGKHGSKRPASRRLGRVSSSPIKVFSSHRKRLSCFAGDLGE